MILVCRMEPHKTKIPKTEKRKNTLLPTSINMIQAISDYLKKTHPGGWKSLHDQKFSFHYLLSSMSFALQLRTGRYLSNQLHKYIQSVSRNADLYVRNLFFISRHALDDMPGMPIFYVGFKTTTQHRDKINLPSPDFALNMDFAIIICCFAAGM